MRGSDVLLCLSLEEQQQDEIHDRLTRRGHLSDSSSLRKALGRLITAGLVVTRRTENRERFYRLAEGEAVEAALNEAWARAEVGQGHSEAPKV